GGRQLEQVQRGQRGGDQLGMVVGSEVVGDEGVEAEVGGRRSSQADTQPPGGRVTPVRYPERPRRSRGPRLVWGQQEDAQRRQRDRERPDGQRRLPVVNES